MNAYLFNCFTRRSLFANMQLLLLTQSDQLAYGRLYFKHLTVLKKLFWHHPWFGGILLVAQYPEIAAHTFEELDL